MVRVRHLTAAPGHRPPYATIEPVFWPLWTGHPQKWGWCPSTYGHREITRLGDVQTGRPWRYRECPQRRDLKEKPHGLHRLEEPPLRPADPRTLEEVPRDQRPGAPRSPDPHLRAAGQVHRLPQGARDAGPLRGR